MISVETVGSSLVLKFNTDRFDATNASLFSEAVENLRLDDMEFISLNFESVKMIDSSAVGILLDFYKSLPESKRSITITHPQPAVASMIEFLRLHRVFRIE